MTYDWQIQAGDEVKVIIQDEPLIAYTGIVRYTPQATGDAWIIEDKEGGICYQQTYNRIIRIKKYRDTP